MRDEQVRRYARHILLPDVGGLGQTALLVVDARGSSCARASRGRADRGDVPRRGRRRHARRRAAPPTPQLAQHRGARPRHAGSSTDGDGRDVAARAAARVVAAADGDATRARVLARRHRGDALDGRRSRTE